MKVVVGVGDSWTQGVGGVSLDQYIAWGGRVDRDDVATKGLYPAEIRNSWVNQLCVNHMPDHTPVNVGMRGYGNRGAVKNLYYSHFDWSQVTGGWLIFMLSGRIRFDFPQKHVSTSRRRMLTLYPHDTTNENKFYLNNLFSEHTAQQETLFALLEAQTFAKAHGLKFAFAYSFDNCDDIWGDPYGLSTHIDQGLCLTPGTTFLDRLVSLDGCPNDWAWYMAQPMPQKYVSNCIHPTIEGYKVIASDIWEIIKQ